MLAREHKTILDECWRPRSRAISIPATAGSDASSRYNYDRVHHGRLTRGRIPADIIYGARKMETR